MRKYYYDLKIEAGTNQRLIPVTVIGKTKAGKTSLVRSVQQNKRVLTERNTTEGKLNESTKVFKVCEADFQTTICGLRRSVNLSLLLSIDIQSSICNVISDRH